MMLRGLYCCSAALLQTFYVLRHGETDANAAGILQGSSDRSRLTETGRNQALAVGALAFQPQQQQDLATTSTSIAMDHVFCSPLTRARETLSLVRQNAPLGALPLQETVLPNLREIDFYAWQDQSKCHLKRHYPEEFAAWKRGDPHGVIVPENDDTSNARRRTVRWPLIETWERAANVWDEVRALSSTTTAAMSNNKDHRANTHTLLVCHGTLAQALLAQAFSHQFELETFFRQYPFPNCGMAEITWDTRHTTAQSWRWRLVCDPNTGKLVHSPATACPVDCMV